MSNIKIVKGDIFKSNVSIIIHQTNCYGRMGGGFAKDVREHYPNVYNEYRKLCNMVEPQQLLGGIQTIKCKDRFVINMFGQLQYGRDKQYTDYEVVESGLNHVINICKENNIKTIGLPFKMGCSLAGGDWTTVYGIIKKVFEETDLEVYIFEKI